MRRKVKLAYIDNESARKLSFKKRRSGLMKKVQELATLCDVSACIVVFGPGEFDAAAVWPNEEDARRLIQRYSQVPEIERCKKRVSQEGYLKERSGKMCIQVENLVRNNKDAVLIRVLKLIRAHVPLKEIGVMELQGLARMVDEKVTEVDRKMEETVPLDWMFGSLGQGLMTRDQDRGHRFHCGFSSYGSSVDVISDSDQEMGIGRTFSLPGNSFGSKFGSVCGGNFENVRFGFVPRGKGVFVGDNSNVNYLFKYASADIQGMSSKDIDKIGGNNVNGGMATRERDGSVTSEESGNNSGVYYDFDKYWNAFFAPNL